MQHHTGQHLFTWALDVYAHELRSRGLSATVQFHGGSVHPDRFVVDAAIVDPSASASTNDTESLHGIIKRLESFCRKIIEDGLPVSVVSLPWSAVAEDHRIRRFPWVNYPNIVRAVRIGDWPSASALSATAELCCGTHLMSTADLVDLVVVSVRSRQQTTKQFTAIVGERARTTRLYGESIVADALARESNASKTELANHIDWILWIFHHTNPKHPNTQPLPIVARDLLEACLQRMKKGRVFTPPIPPMDETTSLADQIAELFERAHSSPLVAPVNFSRLDAVFKALVHLNPLNPGIFYNATTAVLFCPNATDIPGFSSLDVAKSIATRMSNSSLCGAIAIKARPLRSSANKGTAGRFKFALLELENPADSQWSSYHNLLESHFKDALLLLSSDTSDPLAKKA
ncbi:unnamed protein product [Dicrocoelium dendriticum]|nr:unnamed protein product [Dicrocoelium dendriticum]